jgi:hypothetical protein
MWDITKPGRPFHNPGDLIVPIAPGPGAEFPGFMSAGSFELEGPVAIMGFDLRPRGDLPADYSTSREPVLGLRGAMMPFRFSDKCHSHWKWARGNDAFVYLSNTTLDYKNNSDNKPASFADLMKIKVNGANANKPAGKGRPPKISILVSRVRIEQGPHYVSQTVDPGQNGHSDFLQCMGGIDHAAAGDCYLRACGMQVFFLGREATVCGYDSSTLWELTRVTMDHREAWNPYVKPHDFSRHPKFVQGFEGEKVGLERTNLGAGQYLSTRFTDCNIRGPYKKTDAANVKLYLSPSNTVQGVDPTTGLFRFGKRAYGRAKLPMYAGTLKYFEADETLPTLCPPAMCGPKHRVTSPEEALAAIINTL